MDDNLPLPIFHDATLALQLMEHADAGHDDAETQAAAAQRLAAADAIKHARAAHAKAARVAHALPAGVLADLQAREARAKAEAEAISLHWRDAADARLRRARARRREVLEQATACPKDVDPVGDRLDKAERLRRLEALDPEERRLMLTTAAREGTHPELLRAALTAEAPLWPTTSWAPLLPDDVATQLREWIMCRRAPETIGDIWAAWRLRRLACDLDLDRAGFPHPGQPPSLAMLNLREPLKGR